MLTYDMDARGEDSLYAHLYRCIRADIESGAVAAGERLPSKRALARNLGVSVVTVEGAYAQLAAEGYVVSRERRGYFASELPQRPSAFGAAARSGLPGGLPGTASTRAERVDEAFADFSDGALGTRADTAALWGRAVRRALVEEPAAELFADLPAEGHPRLRRAIASHLRSSRGMDVDPTRIVVVAGAQLSYLMVAQLVGADARMAVEDPGFARVSRTYGAAGLGVCPVGLDGQGIDMRRLARADAVGVHVMPSHQFPTGIVMSAARRYELLGWAAAAEGRFVVEDDYDCEFRLSGRPVPALAGIDALGKVAYLNTFSKSLSSALRVAYLVLPPEMAVRFRDELGFYASTVSALDQIALARLIESGDYERHINRVRTRHRAVRDALVTALREADRLDRLRFHGLDAGLHFVLEVEGADEARIVREAHERGIVLAPLSRYCADPANLLPGNPRFVMQYGTLSAEEAEPCADRLSSAVATATAA